MSVFDMLGIDETDGIDSAEIEAIKNTLDRIRVVAAQVAKTNDTTTTLEILRVIEQVVRQVTTSGAQSVDEARQQFATNSQGRPAAQLGSGSQSSQSAQDGLQAIMNDNNVDPGIKQALKRLLTPNDPDHIPVGRDGTPSEIVTVKRELATARTERDNARTELTHERDANRNGSLAKRLADVTNERDAARNNVGGYDHTQAKDAADQLLDAIDAQTGKMGGRVDGIGDVKSWVHEFARRVGLRL